LYNESCWGLLKSILHFLGELTI